MVDKSILKDVSTLAVSAKHIYSTVQSHPKTSLSVDQEFVEHNTLPLQYIRQVDLELESVFHLIIYIYLPLVVVGIDVLPAILYQFDVSSASIAKLHLCSQDIVFYPLTIVSVNATLGAKPHGPVVCLNYRIDSGAGESIVRIDIREHQHISGKRLLGTKLQAQHYA